MNTPLTITGQGDHQRHDDPHAFATWRLLALVGAAALAVVAIIETSTVNKRGDSSPLTEQTAAAGTAPRTVPAAANKTLQDPAGRTSARAPRLAGFKD